MNTEAAERAHIMRIADTLQDRATKAAINKYRPMSKKSVMVDFEREACGLTLTGVVEVEPGEPATWNDPGVPTYGEVREIYIVGCDEDCYELINPALLQRIAAEEVAQYEGH